MKENKKKGQTKSYKGVREQLDKNSLEYNIPVLTEEILTNFIKELTYSYKIRQEIKKENLKLLLDWLNKNGYEGKEREK